MAKVNYDYPLNPNLTKQKISEDSLSERWCVYAYYTINNRRIQYKESSGLNDKEYTLEIREQKAEIVKTNLIEKLLTRTFDP